MREFDKACAGRMSVLIAGVGGEILVVVGVEQE